jgi:hypothetical protein
MSSVEAGELVRQALLEVHNPTDQGIEWCVIGYKSKTELKVIATGLGGIDQAAQHLPHNDLAYALLRYKLKIDQSQMERFVFLDWTPDATPPLRKSLSSTHKGAIHKLFDPFHVDLIASDSSDLDEQIIVKKIKAASGTLDNVLTHKVLPANQHVVKAPKPAPFVHPAVKIDFVQEDEFRATMRGLRDTNSPTSAWVLCALNDKLALYVVASGNGPAEDMRPFIVEGTANYGVVRITDVIDKSVTSKYAYVVYLPDSVPPMRKAKISTIAGSIKETFAPVHVDLFASFKEEITQDGLVDKVKSASGTKSNVK